MPSKIARQTRHFVHSLSANYKLEWAQKFRALRAVFEYQLLLAATGCFVHN